MKSVVAIAITAILFVAPTGAQARCQTHNCWHRVHVSNVENYVQRKINAITTFGPCFGGMWAVPCGIIDNESDGGWNTVNIPCLKAQGFFGHCARGPYQFLGWPVPWPVIIPHNPLRTLINMYKHHRQAKKLWGQQRAGIACHWCG